MNAFVLGSKFSVAAIFCCTPTGSAAASACKTRYWAPEFCCSTAASQHGSISRRARARDSASGIGSGSILISRAGRSIVRVSSIVIPRSPGLTNRPQNRNPSPRAKRNTEPWRKPPSTNRPSASVWIAVRCGPSLGWKTSMPSTGFPCRSTTRPLSVSSDRWIIGSKTRGCSVIVIQSDRIGSIPGA
jgi:hypothetical protein